jgi:Cell wall-associated hydrolases (invasion-associated proteins)
MKNKLPQIIFLFFISFLVLSCASRTTRLEPESPVQKNKPLELMGYTIQAGAFGKVENAVRLTETLKKRGLNATYFKAADGLFKVRFGNFSTKDNARQKAQSLKDAHLIAEFYIVKPEDYTVARQKQYGTNYLRDALVKSARDFIGVPYLWGGASSEKGFDCSGLTMTVYQLNGLNLPRHSRTQYDAGTHVSKSQLQKGDLVFFAKNNKTKVSHVGIYAGDGKFIHAPSHGKKIRIESLSTPYFAKKFVGGRNYL